MRSIACAALALAAISAPAAHAAAPGRLEFELLRNGHPDGRHIVEVTQTPAGFNVSTAVTIRVRVGPLTVFQYEQRCRETWAQDALASLACATTKQGRRSEVAARLADGRMLVTGASGETRFPLAALPTSWWTKPPVFNGAMIDTETGRAMNVRVTHVGRETLTIGGERVAADHVRVQGTLTADLWYDTEGRWIGCTFTAQGQRFEYRLVSPRGDGPRGLG
ncbi:MAG: DUF6134 family protein [Terricaulis sp.]